MGKAATVVYRFILKPWRCVLTSIPPLLCVVLLYIPPTQAHLQTCYINKNTHIWHLCPTFPLAFPIAPWSILTGGICSAGCRLHSGGCWWAVWKLHYLWWGKPSASDRHQTGTGTASHTRSKAIKRSPRTFSDASFHWKHETHRPPCWEPQRRQIKKLPKLEILRETTTAFDKCRCESIAPICQEMSFGIMINFFTDEHGHLHLCPSSKKKKTPKKHLTATLHRHRRI